MHKLIFSGVIMEKEKNNDEIQNIIEKYKKRNKYINDYMKNKYDRIAVLLPKGYKNMIDEKAALNGFKSVNEYIKFLIDQDNKNPEPGPAQEPGAADNSIFIFD